MKKTIKVLITFLIIICVGLLVYSGYHIYDWFLSNKKIDEQVTNIEDNAKVEEVDDNKNVKLVNPVKDKKDPYWDFIKVKLINVNLDKLKKINNDTKGWIQVKGTNVNYPFVQTTDNDYYLFHQFDKKYNTAGWIFMDYRNKVDDLDDNTILYGHGRLNKTMFGSLRNVIKSDWYSKSDNHIIRISTDSSNTLWQVFSTYRIKTTNDYLYNNFSDDTSRLKFFNALKRRSVYDYKVELTAQDKIITLSTCHNDTDKIVLHAKLIKIEKK